MKTQIQIFLELGLFTLLVGCASGPQLDKYPRREIDRPYTLPTGMAEGNVSFSVLTDTDDFVAGTSTSPSRMGVGWKTALSDDWSLIVGFLALEGVHQFSYDNSGYTGLTFGLDGIGYNPTEDTIYYTHIEATRLQKISSNFGLIPSIAVEDIFHGASENAPFLSASVYLRLVYQLADTLALYPAFDFQYSPLRDYDPISGDYLGGSGYSMTYSPELALDWSVSRQIDLDFGYKHTALGYPNDYVGNDYSIKMSFLW